MGGGAMRAAAKLAGIAAATGLRGGTAEHSSVSSSFRRAASLRPAAATTTAVEDVKLAATNNEAGLQRPCLEAEDWVFAGGEEADFVGRGESMPRVVFGGAPTLQEAKEATSELAAALGEVYQSSPDSFGYEDPVVDTKGCVSSGKAVISGLPSPAITAFRFIQQSTAAQNVVASIACDQNVWTAVLQNEELQKFLHSQKAYFSNSDMNFHTEVMEKNTHINNKSFAYDKSPDSEPDGGIMNILKKIKYAVVDMMSSLSDYFHILFGGKGVNGVFVNSDGSAKLSGESAMGASVMGLAVMAILIILLKRA